jgi:hypothetical protein
MMLWKRAKQLSLTASMGPEIRLHEEPSMFNPKEAIDARWLEYREEFIPDNAHSSQKAALGYAYYSGMKGLMEIFHKMSATEPMPTDVEITAFMNGLETALSELHDAVCFPE